MPATNEQQAHPDAYQADIHASTTPTDASLIDAAPDLLAALKMIIREVSGGRKPYSSDSYLPEKFQDVALAAIAKAEGRA